MKLVLSIKIIVMKKISLILTMLIMFAVLGSAQNVQRRQKLEVEKIAFFTSKLDLSPDEARVFWPVYNEFSMKRSELNKQKNEVLKSINKELSEEELEEAGDKIVDFAVKEAELSKKYHNEFKKILSAKKVLSLYQVEDQFRRVLLKQLRDRRSEATQDRRRQQLK